MTNPGLPRAKLQAALDALADADGNQSEASRRLRIPLPTYRNQLIRAREAQLTPHTPRREKPRVRIPARHEYQAQPPGDFGPSLRVMVFGCAHDSPNIPDKSRFRHAGRLASDLAPDFIVDLGDSLDLDSLSSHAIPGSQDDRARPAFLTEIASLEDAYGEFEATAPAADEIPRYHLHGNHEFRAWRFEGTNPTTEGVYTLPIEQVFARYNWTTKAYREWLFLAGVGFTHVPINMMGKEYGGKTAENLVLNETTFSLCWSHTHRHHYARRPKIGIGNGAVSYNTGCFMPQGYIKPYAGLSMTGWTYGIHELTLRDGTIESARTWSVQEIAERYA